MKLTPGTILLAEGTIAAQQDAQYLQTLVLKAYQKAKKQASQKTSAQAFYRQTTSNDSAYSEVYEIFYQTQVSTTGIQEWQPLEGRCAISKDLAKNNYVYTYNLPFFRRPFICWGSPLQRPF
ncbi:hypothetical protein Q0590_23655 [Rhodocytophaga aerolata]|uniref:Uncharacterized protein n=1 Tax=Rhodocytophaga aerolata TaxID=455078 RepID=A0ABT8RDK7_9BACT|nr:hypothetical protein [Rhodocytophaga aerolata]MDO1449293.1 hypothetical protein [Rhodocytophaga aerolata]